MIRHVYLAGGARTPIGGFCGLFSDISAIDLAVTALKGSLTKTGLPPDRIDDVIIGNVLSAGLGQNIARQIGLKTGLPDKIGGTTINKVCGSGLKSIMMAAQAIQCEDAGVVIAGGTENMTQAPYLLKNARTGYRLNHGKLLDSAVHDGLWDVMSDVHMGEFGDELGVKYGFTRQMQDDYAVRSYKKALKARAEGLTASEIVPVEIKSRKGTRLVEEDEEPNRFDEDKLRALRPAFGEDGSVTAGNASSLNDGAAIFQLFSESKCQELQIQPQARILSYASAAREPKWFTIAPVNAIQAALQKCQLKVEDIDLFEINEAFSVVPMAAMHDLHIPEEKVNILGGAVALGHPIGASGARTLVTLLNAMKIRGAKLGVNALCIGGGEGVAMVVELC